MKRDTGTMAAVLAVLATVGLFSVVMYSLLSAFSA